MEKYLVAAALILASAVSVPKFLAPALDAGPADERPTQQVMAVQQDTGGRERSFNPLDGRKARIEMDRRGHFITDARMNGRTAEVLVDTGATYVAINESQARRLGIKLKNSDFKYKVSTANGTTEAAAAIIDEIEIGRVSARNVQATVLRDEALKGTLLGMSFLKKLRKFEISGNELILVQ
ncbi:MAG: TIGR02281 family clan AA aspartic protease [Nitratireductor sp.]|nr:TIGR02281 family clan AA aspartic protease [Nitratireductor sp.]